MKKFTFQSATTIINEFWFLSRIMTQGSSSLLEAQVLTWLNVQLRKTHNCNTDSILSILLWSRKEPEETLSALMVKKENHLYEVRSFMCQKDLGILQCGRRQRRFNLSLDCMWCGWAISQGVYKCKRNDNALQKGWKGNLFCLITTFAVFTNSCVSWRLTFYLRSHFSWFLVKWSWVHK